MSFTYSLLGVVMLGLTVTSVEAAPVIYNNTIPAGTVAFDATVVGAGGIVVVDALSGLTAGNTWVRSGYTITSTDSSSRFIDTSYLASGDSIGIDPDIPASGSGLTFTFNSGVNAFGLEIGDWATCCYDPSSLYISFNGGSTRLVASAFSSSDNPGYVAELGYQNFVGAIDTTSTFNTVSFYGDGVGEYLVAGGTIRYATLDIGSVPEIPAVPEPETYAMLLAGIGMVGFMVRRREKSQV